ncbi:hypothetical protein BS47DRAFT_1332343 [Hydnum rufescens UP504]|uniref:DUF3533 domain-containing protein n=1 Tax=Hydnum rufescens UP504 TaxID=1448309 RepID=A0A9P6DS78_9AGAM|nr:hypothetical protein BS47DRAFT_1332343 [Hydnum rufescens UP504]
MYSSDDIRDVLSKPASVKHASSNSLRSVRTRKNSSTHFPTVTNVPPSPPPLIKFSYSFWAPELSWLRRSYLKVMAQTLILTVILVWICIPVYFGSLAHQRSYSDRLHVWFVDMDGSDIGSAMRTAVQANINTNTKAKLGWIIKDASNFPTITDVSNQIVDERAWAALVVSRNATSNLISARENGDASYNQSTAMVFLYNQGRNEVAANSFIVPLSQALISSAAANFAASYASRYLASQSGNATAMAALIAAPQTLTTPISYSMNNLRPYSAPVASALTLVGSIYTIIFAFVITLSGYAIRQAIEPFLKTKDLLLLRVLAPPIFYIPISVAYSMISLCFKVPFNAKYNRAGGFFIFWLYDFMGMTALGLSTEAMITLLTPKYMTYFLVPLIIFNVAVSSVPITLEPWFYKYGYGFPVYNMQQATRTLIFNTKSHLGLNAGILIAWIALSCFTIPLFAFIMRRRAMAAAAREATSRSGAAPHNDSSHDPDSTPRNSVDGIHPDQGKLEESKNDADAEVMSIDEKSPAHDSGLPALKSRSNETFDIERQQ